MSQENSILKKRLKARVDKGNLRTLKITDDKSIDFTSNDYLGLARNLTLKTKIIERYATNPDLNGSTGSRLLSGNSIQIEQLEVKLAKLFSAPKTLIFSSGYMANLAFFSSVPQKNDVILYDELCHASIKDGCRLSLAQKISFKHNDLAHLKTKLEHLKSKCTIYVAIEAVYSMDGDFALLDEIAHLCDGHSAKLVVDEAHSTGIWGDQGGGFVKSKGLENKVFARIMTFGKAMGIHGACICGSELLRDYLINFSGPFIYTTAPGAFELVAISEAFEFIKENQQLGITLKRNIDLFKKEIGLSSAEIIESNSPIQIIKIAGNENAMKLSLYLSKSGYDIRAITSPTVPLGQERLRICIHAFNTEDEILRLCQLLNAYFKK
jgi:8-amino-7-oxononanoate synthase